MTNNMKSVCAALGLLVFSIDQFIKVWIRRFGMYEVIFRLDKVIEIVHCQNTGAAFSMLSGFPYLIAVISFLLMLAAAAFLMRSMHIPTGAGIAFALLLGGGISNLLDRILFGSVTDYIRLLFIHFPVFNAADVCITGSVIALVIYLWTGRLDVYPDQYTHGTDH